MGLVNFDSKAEWTLIGLPGTARVARALADTKQRNTSVVFEQPTGPLSPLHVQHSLVGSRLSVVSMGSEESHVSSADSPQPAGGEPGSAMMANGRSAGTTSIAAPLAPDAVMPSSGMATKPGPPDRL